MNNYGFYMDLMNCDCGWNMAAENIQKLNIPIKLTPRIFLDKEPIRAREKHYSLVCYILPSRQVARWIFFTWH